MKRRVLLLLMAVGFVALLASRRSEIGELLTTLAKAQWQWLLVAAALQLVYAVLYAALHQAAFAVVGVRSRVRELLPVLFASVFVNVAAPMTGAAGVALFADDAARRGQSGTRSAVGSLLVMLVDFVAFSTVLVAGMALLLQRDALRSYQLLAALGLLGMTAAMVGLLALAATAPNLLRRLLESVQALAERIGQLLRRPSWLPSSWAARNAGEFSAAARAVAEHPRELVRALQWGLAMHLADLITVCVLFQAFGRAVGMDVLVAGYAMGMLFWIVAVTPSGVGVVEGVMTATFVALGVPLPIATVVVLAYRGLGFWLPAGIGFLMLRQLRSFGAAGRVRGWRQGLRNALRPALACRLWECVRVPLLGGLTVLGLAVARPASSGLMLRQGAVLLALMWYLWFLSAVPRASEEPPQRGWHAKGPVLVNPRALFLCLV